YCADGLSQLCCDLTVSEIIKVVQLYRLLIAMWQPSHLYLEFMPTFATAGLFIRPGGLVLQVKQRAIFHQVKRDRWQASRACIMFSRIVIKDVARDLVQPGF